MLYSGGEMREIYEIMGKDVHLIRKKEKNYCRVMMEIISSCLSSLRRIERKNYGRKTRKLRRERLAEGGDHVFYDFNLGNGRCSVRTDIFHAMNPYNQSSNIFRGNVNS